MTENPEKFIDLLRSHISDTKKGAIDWDGDVERVGNRELRVSEERKKRGKNGNPEAFMLRIFLGSWSSDQIKEFAEMIPRGGEDGKESSIDFFGEDDHFPYAQMVIIMRDKYTDAYKLIIREGILNSCREGFSRGDKE